MTDPNKEIAMPDIPADGKGFVAELAGPFRRPVQSPPVSPDPDSGRGTDNPARYHVRVSCERQPMPEGLARVLDMLQRSVGPISPPPGDDKP